jgi:hypothetical protein
LVGVVALEVPGTWVDIEQRRLDYLALFIPVFALPPWVMLDLALLRTPRASAGRAGHGGPLPVPARVVPRCGPAEAAGTQEGRLVGCLLSALAVSIAVVAPIGLWLVLLANRWTLNPDWVEDPAARRVAETWAKPTLSGHTVGCGRQHCRAYDDLPPWREASWAEVPGTNARRLTLDHGPLDLCDWKRWAPRGTRAYWKYDGNTVRLLSGGSISETYFTAFASPTGRDCTIILMTADWPAHRND